MNRSTLIALITCNHPQSKWGVSMQLRTQLALPNLQSQKLNGILRGGTGQLDITTGSSRLLKSLD